MRPVPRAIICFDTARISSTGASRLTRRIRLAALGVVVDGNRGLHAGVVDQDVNLAERLDQLGNAGEVGQVVLDFALQIQPKDPQSGFRQGLGDGAADAARRAGDQRGLQPPANRAS